MHPPAEAAVDVPLIGHLLQFAREYAMGLPRVRHTFF